MQEPIIIKLNKNSDDIKPLFRASQLISYPLYKYGYIRYYPITQLYIKQNIDNLTNKQKVYNIINNYDIELLKKVLNVKLENISYDFFKLYEINFIFNILKNNSSILLLNDYSKQFELYLNYNKITSFSHNINNNKFDVILANTKDNDIGDILEEQHVYNLLLSQINTISSLKNNGKFVMKLFETFTENSINILDLLCTYFDSCFIFKPLSDNYMYSTKYFIGIGYNGKKCDVSNLLKHISSLKPEQHINQLFNNYNKISINNDIYCNLNKLIGNYQYMSLNQMMTYIKNNNYFGEEYHNYHNNQIKCIENWKNIYISKTQKINFNI